MDDVTFLTWAEAPQSLERSSSSSNEIRTSLFSIIQINIDFDLIPSSLLNVFSWTRGHGRNGIETVIGWFRTLFRESINYKFWISKKIWSCDPASKRTSLEILSHLRTAWAEISTIDFFRNSKILHLLEIKFETYHYGFEFRL